MGVGGVEMAEAPGRVEEPATAAAAPALLAALVMALGVPGLEVLVMEAVETVMEPAIAAVLPMPPLLRLMPPLPLRLMPLPLTPLPLTQRLRLLLTLPPLMRLPPMRPPWIIRPSTILP